MLGKKKDIENFRRRARVQYTASSMATPAASAANPDAAAKRRHRAKSSGR